MLSAELTGSERAGGGLHGLLRFNTSSQACTLTGHPRMFFVDDKGHQIGGPFRQIPADLGVATLVPGTSASASFSLYTDQVREVARCQPTQVIGLRVYPPDESTALFVASATRVCAVPQNDGSASITPVSGQR